MVRWFWVNFQCQGVLLIWIRVGQGPTALAVGAGGGCLDIFSLVYHFSFLSPSLWETVRYRLKYCLKGPLSPKQPTNLITFKVYEQTLKNIGSFSSRKLMNTSIFKQVSGYFTFLNSLQSLTYWVFFERCTCIAECEIEY